MAVERFLLGAQHRDSFGRSALQKALDPFTEGHRLSESLVLDLSVDVARAVVGAGPQLLA